MTIPPDQLAAALIRAARAQPGVRVLYATPTLTPTPTQVLDDCERQIGAKLPAEVRAFYAGTTQLGLVWQHDVGTETTVQPADWAELCDTDGAWWRSNVRPSRDYTKSGGMICIPSAAEVFRKDYWIDRIVPEPCDDDVTVDGDDSWKDAEIYADLYPFDFISTYYCAGLWFNRRKSEWRVLLADDYGASWFDYASMSVPEYLGVLETSLGGARPCKTSSGDDQELWALRKER